MINVKSLTDWQAVIRLSRLMNYTVTQAVGILWRWRKDVTENEKIGCFLVANLRDGRDLYCAGWRKSQESAIRVGFFVLGKGKVGE